MDAGSVMSPSSERAAITAAATFMKVQDPLSPSNNNNAADNGNNSGSSSLLSSTNHQQQHQSSHQHQSQALGVASSHQSQLSANLQSQLRSNHQAAQQASANNTAQQHQHHQSRPANNHHNAHATAAHRHHQPQGAAATLPPAGHASHPSLASMMLPLSSVMTIAVPAAAAPMHALSSSLPTHLSTATAPPSAPAVQRNAYPRAQQVLRQPRGGAQHGSMHQQQQVMTMRRQQQQQQPPLQQVTSQGVSGVMGHHQVVAMSSSSSSQRQQQRRCRHPSRLGSDAVVCVACGFAGADVRIKCSTRPPADPGGAAAAGNDNATNTSNNGNPKRKPGCNFHARCIDLLSICNSREPNRTSIAQGDNILIKQCPHCQREANGLEILPLSFGELDRSQRVVLQKRGVLLGGGGMGSSSGGGGAGSSMGGAGSGGGGGGGHNNNNNNNPIIGGSAIANNNNGNNDEHHQHHQSSEMSKKRSMSDLENAATGSSSKSGSYPSNIAQACRATNGGNGNTASAHHLPSSGISSSSSASNGGNINNGNPASSQCYDPTVPRTGRWTDEELAFRDAIIAYFLEGSLPLSNGLKLNDFLSNMLKSKQSRLTKKMKHAKLSTKYFRIKAGYLTNHPRQNRSKEFSSLEYNFVNVIADPVERSEIQFHMQREWRDHLAERCTYLRILFDADDWLRSVDAMDRRVALEKNRSRMVKRRCLMGKAMEKDASESIPGVFIDRGGDRGKEDFLADVEDKQARQMLQPNSVEGRTGGDSGGGGNTKEDGDFGRFLMSLLDEAPIAASPNMTGIAPKKEKTIRSSYCDPNFRYAAPFLAGITSYIERNGVPFEHVDIWVPSRIPAGLEKEGESAPRIGSMGSGSCGNLVGIDRSYSAGSGVGGPGGGGGGGGDTCRLCFAGSATLGVQIVDEVTSAAITDASSKSDATKRRSESISKKIAPLTGDEIFNFSLYGDYSEKFSFSSGCGLPGRVFRSGIAAWEQFLTNAPPEMFERRGGAIQFGIKTALGLPIDSPNVGRIVVVLYSKHNREKDEELVNRMVKDVRLFNPCPRWKLVVDVRSSGNGGGEAPSPVIAQPPPPNTAMANSGSFSAGMSALSMRSATNLQQQAAIGMDIGDNGTTSAHQAAGMFANNSKEGEVINLISLLQENMPSDPNSPLGKQLNSIMSLRLILLRGNARSTEEEQLVDTILVLYESYISAGRSRSDIALLVTRDYEFHMGHQHQQQQGGRSMVMAPTAAPAMNAHHHHHLQSQQQHMSYQQQPIIHEGIVAMDTNTSFLPQQHLGVVLHNPSFVNNNNQQQQQHQQPGPLGGRPRTASVASAGSSFIPPPPPPGVAPGLSPGMPGIGMPAPPVPAAPAFVGLQNVVHPPYQLMDMSQGSQPPAGLLGSLGSPLLHANVNGSQLSLAAAQAPKSPM